MMVVLITPQGTWIPKVLVAQNGKLGSSLLIMCLRLGKGFEDLGGDCRA